MSLGLGLGLGLTRRRGGISRFLDLFNLGADGMAFSSRLLSSPSTNVIRGLLTGTSTETDSETFLGAVVPADVQALYDNRAYLAGDDDFIDLNHTFDEISTSNQFNIKFKMLLASVPTAGNDYKVLFSNRAAVSGVFIYVAPAANSATGNAALRPHVHDSTGFRSFDTAFEPEVGVIYDIELIGDGSDMTLKVNGAEDAISTTYNGSINAFTSDMSIGDDSAEDNMNGVMWDYVFASDAAGINIISSYEGYGNTDADWEDQTGSNDGTVNGSPALFTGQGSSGTAPVWYDQTIPQKDRRFFGNGVDSEALAGSSLVPALDDFTLEVDVYIPTGYTPADSNDLFFEQATSTGNFFGFSLSNVGELRLFPANPVAIGTTSFNRDEWITLKTVRTSGVFQFFINDALINSYNASGVSIGQTAFAVGYSTILSGGRHCEAGIKNIRLNGVQAYTGQVVDGEILDQTGGGNDLTVSGSPYEISATTGALVRNLIQSTEAEQPDIVTNGATTKIGALDALVSDGSEFMTIDHNVVNDPTTYLMISGVVTATTNGYFISKYDTTIGRSWGMRVTNNNFVVAFGDPADGSFEGTWASDDTFDFTVPIVVGFVFNAGVCTLYINGVEVAGTGTVPASLYVSDTDVALFGRLANGALAEPLTGEIAEIIYTTDSTLDVAEIQTNQLKAIAESLDHLWLKQQASDMGVTLVDLGQRAPQKGGYRQDLKQSISDEAGIQSGETTGVQDGVTVGLTDAGALGSLIATLNLNSEAAISSAATSGTGTELDPYVIENVDAGRVLLDNDVNSVYVKIVNSRFSNGTNYELTANSDFNGTVEFENCYFIDESGSGSNQRLKIDAEGTYTFNKCEFGGSHSSLNRLIGLYCGSMTASSTVTLDFENCIFNDDAGDYSSTADIIDNATNNGCTVNINMRYCEGNFTLGTGQYVIEARGGDTIVPNIQNCEFTGFKSVINSVVANTIDIDGAVVKNNLFTDQSEEHLTGLGWKNSEVAYNYALHTTQGAGFRQFFFDARDTDATSVLATAPDSVWVHRNKFTKLTGDKTAGNECLHAEAPKNCTFEYNYVTECPEDAFEFIYPRDGNTMAYNVADNCAGQIVDIYKMCNADGTYITASNDLSTALVTKTYIHHIYGDCEDMAVVIDGVRGVIAHDLYGDNSSGGSTNSNIEIRSRDSVDAREVYIGGPLPLPAAVQPTAGLLDIEATTHDVEVRYWDESNVLQTETN